MRPLQNDSGKCSAQNNNIIYQVDCWALKIATMGEITIEHSLGIKDRYTFWELATISSLCNKTSPVLPGSFRLGFHLGKKPRSEEPPPPRLSPSSSVSPAPQTWCLPVMDVNTHQKPNILSRSAKKKKNLTKWVTICTNIKPLNTHKQCHRPPNLLYIPFPHPTLWKRPHSKSHSHTENSCGH